MSVKGGELPDLKRRSAAWAMIASSPLTVAAFVLPGQVGAVGVAALTLLVIGSLPAARTMASGVFAVVRMGGQID
ncbi:MAG: hypothetical protein ACRDN9_20465 [Streptosporangiaceae bacterium]